MGNLCSRVEVVADDLYSRPWKPSGESNSGGGRRSDGYEVGTPGGRGNVSPCSAAAAALSSPSSARARRGDFLSPDDADVDAPAGDDEPPSSPDARRQVQQQRRRAGPPRSWTRGELIGAGAFGRVYLGLDDETGELFAVKTVSLPSTVSFGDAGGKRGKEKNKDGKKKGGVDDDSDGSDLEDFDDLDATVAAARRNADERRLAPHVEALRSEVELLAGLDHPNIVRYLGTEQRSSALPEGCSSGKVGDGGDGGSEGDASDGGERASPPGAAAAAPKATAKGKKSGQNASATANNLGSELNIFLEYIPGGSIAGLVGRFGPLAERVSASYTRQILLGLAYLHAHGIAHRDVKGANCLVGSAGVVKLADFGASKRIEDVATLETGGFNSIKGTPYWMAPEVIKQTGAGRAADVWSVGCTVIEMVTGKPPWSQKYGSQFSALFAIAQAGGPPPLPDTLSVALRDFLGHCLRRDPRQRPSARALLDHPWITGKSLLKALPPEEVTPLGLGAASLRRGREREGEGGAAPSPSRKRQPPRLQLPDAAAAPTAPLGGHRRGFSSGAPSPVLEDGGEGEGEGPPSGRGRQRPGALAEGAAGLGPLGGGGSRATTGYGGSEATTAATTGGSRPGNGGSEATTGDGGSEATATSPPPNARLPSPSRRSTAASAGPWGAASEASPSSAAVETADDERRETTTTEKKRKEDAPAASPSPAAFANDDVLLATVTSSSVALPLRKMIAEEEKKERGEKGTARKSVAVVAASVSAGRGDSDDVDAGRSWAAVSSSRARSRATGAQAKGAEAAKAASDDDGERDEDPSTPTVASSDDEEGDPPPSAPEDPVAAFEALRRQNAEALLRAGAAAGIGAGGRSGGGLAKGGWAAASLAAIGGSDREKPRPPPPTAAP